MEPPFIVLLSAPLVTYSDQYSVRGDTSAPSLRTRRLCGEVVYGRKSHRRDTEHAEDSQRKATLLTESYESSASHFCR